MQVTSEVNAPVEVVLTDFRGDITVRRSVETGKLEVVCAPRPSADVTEGNTVVRETPDGNLELQAG